MSRVSRALAAVLLVWSINLTGQTGPGTSPAPAGAQAPGPGAPARPAGQPGARANLPPRDTQPQAVGTARVRGRATTDAGQPLRHISLQLTGPGGVRIAITDSDGRYEFTDIPAGTYMVNASHIGYVGTRSDPIDVGEGQRVDGVDLRLLRGGVITGQILDEFGDPVIGATISPLRQQYMNGQRRLLNAGATTITNDIGEFRLFGLAPGHYFVSVSPRNEQINIGARPGDVGPNTAPILPSGTPVGYAPTYYPGAPDPASAQSILVSAGQTVGNISFSLAPTRLARVSGTALDEQGQPLGRGGVTLIRRDRIVGGGGPGGPMRPDGTFVISNVPPGSYIARATIPPAPRDVSAQGVRREPPRFAIADVTVNGDDVSGVVLMPVRPATIRGRLIFDDPAAASSVTPSSFRVLSQRLDLTGPPLMGGPAAAGQVNDDYTFELTASPEPSNIRVASGVQARVMIAGAAAGVAGVQRAAQSSQAQQPPWRLKAVRVRGVDVTDTGVDLRPGDTVDDVELEMTSKTQTLTGSVTNGSTPARRAWVIVFPQNRDLWTSTSGRYNSRAITDDTGAFKITSLPPGAYYAIASPLQTGPGVPPSTDWNDPDVLETAARSATSVTLTEGGTATVDLRLSTP